MEIYINEDKVPFELEKEKNSYEIINAISEFAANSNPKHFITSIFINDQEYSYADEKGLKKLKIDSIKRIEIETGDIFSVTNLSIDQMENFLDLLDEIISEKKWNKAYTEIGGSINWMKAGINQIVVIFSSKENYLKDEKKKIYENCDKLNDLFSNIETDEFLSNNGIIKESLNYIKNIRISIGNIKKYLNDFYRLPGRDNVLGNINKLVKDIDIIIPQLENVPILFQTGEDQESMNTIQALADILERSINFFVLFKESFKLYMDKYTVKEVYFEEFFKTLTSHLKELMDAIQHKDSVMMGDLLEYEFVPNIEEIKNILVKIRDEAFTKAN